MEIPIFSSISTIFGSASANVPGSKDPGGNHGASTADDAEKKAAGDLVELTPEAREYSRNGQSPSASDASSASAGGTSYLTREQQEQLQELKIRDREVHTHEQAHLSAAGHYAAGSASFTYQLGPDGSRYAIGGEVPIDISKEPTPEATIQKMQTIRAAALAPAEPSAADRQIAAQAATTAAQAQQDLIMMQRERTTKAAGESADKEGMVADTEAADSTSSRDYPSGITVSAMINAYTYMQTLG